MKDVICSLFFEKFTVSLVLKIKDPQNFLFQALAGLRSRRIRNHANYNFSTKAMLDLGVQ